MKESSEKELSYTLQSHKIKCPTVLLKVYTDKTYEYVNGDMISVGSFPYSMAEIILNVYDYDSGNGDVYEIKTKDNIATTIYDNNGKLKEMLSLSNINLDVCEQPTLVNKKSHLFDCLQFDNMVQFIWEYLTVECLPPKGGDDMTKKDLLILSLIIIIILLIILLFK